MGGGKGRRERGGVENKGKGGWREEEGEGRSKMGVEREVEREVEKGGRVERGGGKGEKGNGMVEKEGGRRGICSPYTRFVMLGVKRVGGRWECFSDPHPVCQLITSFSWYSIEKA